MVYYEVPVNNTTAIRNGIVKSFTLSYIPICKCKYFRRYRRKTIFTTMRRGKRAAILVSPLVSLRSTALRMNGSHVITAAAHGTNTHSSRVRTDQGGAERRAGLRCAAWHFSVSWSDIINRYRRAETFDYCQNGSK